MTADPSTPLIAPTLPVSPSRRRGLRCRGARPWWPPGLGDADLRLYGDHVLHRLGPRFPHHPREHWSWWLAASRSAAGLPVATTALEHGCAAAVGAALVHGRCRACVGPGWVCGCSRRSRSARASLLARGWGGSRFLHEGLTLRSSIHGSFFTSSSAVMACMRPGGAACAGLVGCD